MESATVQKLLELNREFYQTFALQFSQTRQRVQPGVRKIIGKIPLSASILDLGCGNGELARELGARDQLGVYYGLDMSEGLLKEACKFEDYPGWKVRYFQVDLSQPGWIGSLPSINYDYILSFAVLHHLPGQTLRQIFIESLRSLLKPGGQFIHSEWQFLDSARLRERILPWDLIGIDPAQVDTGDYLLDWRSGGTGIRYVHYFTPEELLTLAENTGFNILESFYSDGSNGRLSYYQIWQPGFHSSS